MKVALVDMDYEYRKPIGSRKAILKVLKARKEKEQSDAE